MFWRDSGSGKFGPVAAASWSRSGWAVGKIASDFMDVERRAAKAEDLRTGAAESVCRWWGEAV